MSRAPPQRDPRRDMQWLAPWLTAHVNAEGIEMISEWTSHLPRHRLAGVVLVAAATATLLAGSGTTALAAGPAPAGGTTGLTARAVPAGGIISTVAGGVGGPGAGTGISLSDANGPACRLPNTVTFAAGN